jgi:hypothetical protein
MVTGGIMSGPATVLGTGAYEGAYEGESEGAYVGLPTGDNVFKYTGTGTEAATVWGTGAYVG